VSRLKSPPNFPHAFGLVIVGRFLEAQEIMMFRLDLMMPIKFSKKGSTGRLVRDDYFGLWLRM
jgi:hypothetical protein